MNEPKTFSVWAHISCATWIPDTYFEEHKNSCIIKGKSFCGFIRVHFEFKPNFEYNYGKDNNFKWK